ncbi:hypothetical protein [Variovorax sp. UMC13]|uniref:hypothetical protein n=1 Tax=Variovorax sp. UMC13 TaxID=1862326 RepID=UPI00160205A8|nr:hypothetical protein [Variovorax sp. UMC13]MBB1601898.1 hypothetical protein [Variovorax sp. UMC13]
MLRNAYVTLGKRIAKRPALKPVVSGLTGSHGLEAISGRLKLFVDRGSAFVPPSICDVIELDKPAAAAGADLDRVLYADLFNGYPYVVSRYANRVTWHHYVDANPTTPITDANCPQSNSVTKAASRVFAIGCENVRYCKAGDPRDWTTASDAGFLPAGLQSDTKSACTAVGTFQESLVVFFSEQAQIWNVAVDPAANVLSKRISGVGTQAPLSLAPFSNDLMFLSPYGLRTMTVQAQTNRIDDNDVGVPIDKLVVPDVAAVNAAADPYDSFGVWIHQLGQYWLVMDMGDHSKVWAYTYSKSSKIACWSEYTFPVRISALATLDGRVYVRSTDTLYEVSALQYTDGNQLVPVEIQMAFQDAKTPGINKQVWGADLVAVGSMDFSMKYDPRDLAKESVPQTITGDTRPGDMQPIEVMAPAFAPVFRHSRDEAFELDALSIYYFALGPQ